MRLASESSVDLVLVEGRRPLLGGGAPRGDVGHVLAQAQCDVAVLVEREGVPRLDATHPIVVPFGGAEHDWAALELGAWIAAVHSAPLHLLGTVDLAGRTTPERTIVPGGARRPAVRTRVRRAAPRAAWTGRACLPRPQTLESWWSASPSVGTVRASATSAPRSRAGPLSPLSLFVAASERGSSRHATTSPGSPGRRIGPTLPGKQTFCPPLSGVTTLCVDRA